MSPSQKIACNPVAFSEDRMQPMFRVTQGRRYRLLMRNASDDIHPIHLHRHSFELTKVAGQSTSGVMKDVVMVGVIRKLKLTSSRIIPGPHDFGFMALFEYTSSAHPSPCIVGAKMLRDGETAQQILRSKRVAGTKRTSGSLARSVNFDFDRLIHAEHKCTGILHAPLHIRNGEA
jgi:hypothetical protein